MTVTNKSVHSVTAG